MLTKEKLKDAFSLFDKNGDGSIAPHELKDVLFHGQHFEEGVWENIIKETDKDGNGEIDFEEFCDMMETLLWKDV